MLGCCWQAPTRHRANTKCLLRKIGSYEMGGHICVHFTYLMIIVVQQARNSPAIYFVSKSGDHWSTSSGHFLTTVFNKLIVLYSHILGYIYHASGLCLLLYNVIYLDMAAEQLLLFPVHVSCYRTVV